MKFIALSSLITLLLAGCAASLPAIDPAALPAVPQSFKEGDGRWTLAAPAEAQPRGEWWRSFSDPVLDELVERANRNNTSIQVAAARLRQARAFAQATQADPAPQVSADPGAARVGGILH